MSNIYRKSLLDKMSSPDQLDKMVVITPPSFWIALLGGLVIVTVALVWSILGTLPDKVEAKGIYIPEQDSYIISSEVTGIVSDVSVKVGEEVKEGDELFSIDVSSLQEEREKLEKRRAVVDKITVDSDTDKDVTNSDTQNLLNIKTQLNSAYGNPQYSAYLTSLENYNEALLNAENAKNAAAEAQNAYAEAYAYVDPAHSAELDNTTQQLSNVISQLQTLVFYYESMKNYTDPESAEYKAQEAALNTAKATCLSLPLNGMDISNEAAASNTLTSFTNAYNAQLLANASDPKYSGNSNLAALKSIYESAAQDYANANSVVLSYKSSVDSYEASSASQSSSSVIQAKAYLEQFNAAKGAALDKFDTEIEKYSKQIEDSVVRSTMSGIISNLGVIKGSTIQQGSQAVVIRQVTDSENVICYVPVSSGKKVTEGMKVNIYPTTVDRQEYGHINGTVLSVSDYLATESEIFDKVGDESLVSAFKQEGPVVEVKCVLTPDENSASGYEWSNKKGAEVELASGTMVTADIITEEKQPISLLIPYLKNWLENLTEEK